MEPLTLKPREPIEDEVERWDDDGDFDEADFDAIHNRAASTATATSVASSHTGNNHHRDSISSRMSVRSDLDSNHGDENWDVLLPDGEVSAKDAIAIAKSKGIPIPADVPKSALQGGTIRRLGGKKIKKAMGDDWSEDLDLPDIGGELKLVKNEDIDFPESLRQISAAFQKTPIKIQPIQVSIDQTLASKHQITTISLDSFRDDEEDDCFGDAPTIKVAKSRSPKKPTLITMPVIKAKLELDDMEEDLELPTDGQLKLSTRKEVPSTPHHEDDVDIEWAEGSLGTRHGGTRRDGKDFMSNRSSSASAFSPSASSCITAESEDEGLDCLVLPHGPLKFDEVLKKRQENHSPEDFDSPAERIPPSRAVVKDDFFADLEIGDGDVFDSGKLTLNRNIKHKIERPKSPVKRTATTLTFTNTKSQSTITRIPRFQLSHDRPRPTLEPVSESGPAIPRFKRPESRMGHSTQVPSTGIPAPSTPAAPSTPSRRLLRPQESRDNPPQAMNATSGSQLLRSKRSMPGMRSLNSPGKPPTYARPPSRNDNGGLGSRLNIPPRPKTPTNDRSESRLESRLVDTRRSQIPFLPAGASTSQSQHVSIKSTTTRNFRRNESDGSNDAGVPAQRSVSRLTFRPETPNHGNERMRSSLTAAELAAAAKKTITKPARRRNFGDGTELEIFDDLPTSATIESRFIKQPVGRGAPRSLRSKLSQSLFNSSAISLASRTETPMPTTPLSPSKPEFSVPRFARDTAASRNAREQRQISTAYNPTRERESLGGIGPLQPLSTNWKAHIAARGLASPSAKRKPGKIPQKPQLIKPLGNGVNEPKSIKGMHYNPQMFRWEGNENALAPFDVPPPPFQPPELSPRGSPRQGGPPALITNVGQAGGVQVVGGMVFDPRKMCWLKMAPTQSSNASQPTNLRGGVATLQLEEEEDVFAGLEDLKEEDESRSSQFGGNGGSSSAMMRNASSESRGGDDGTGGGHSSDEFFVSEEFDVGPEFVRRQRSEEEKWRRKVEKWLRPRDIDDGEGRDGWRWSIRDVVLSGL